MKKIIWGEKTALVTGASSGIGRATALLLAQKGVFVVLTARREARLHKLRSEILSFGGKAQVYQADLSQESQRIQLFDCLSSNNLLPDILVNNAGMAWYGYIQEMPWDISREIIDLNNAATIHLSLLFIPNMIKRQFGTIINVGSIAGKLPEQGIALYSASKAFLDAFSKSSNRDLRGTGVNVSVIRSGPVKTEFFDSAKNLENGHAVPAESLAVAPELVAKKIWGVIQRPRRFAYVPWWTAITPLLELFFAGIIDLLGPLLLKRQKH